MIQFLSLKGSGVPERISVMPGEMERIVRELHRDTEIVALLKAESATNV
jgi:hypothetical protein